MLAIQDTSQMMIAARKAVPMLVIRIPGISSAVSPSITALMTRVKRPSVSTVIGRDRVERIGRMTAFTTPKMIAAMIRVVRLENHRPVTRFAAM